MENRMQQTLKIPMILILLALSGCATLPTGPSVMVLPAPGKPFEVFRPRTPPVGAGPSSRSG